MKKDTILLTGASGFLGSHLLESLLDNTEDDIIVLKRSFSKTKRIEHLLPLSRVVAYDIDKHSLQSLPWDAVSSVIHCATEYGRHGIASSQILQSNLIFPINIAELAIKNGG